ncbi:hypothetical protein WH47_06120 [Habropoda laboriosa]|uniref:Uncharacterized protein n=1 Tax=Habropoda laboriosa TaxID=597456 RepID=A0A0L7QS12_9HYME|nr:PREDICTED: uncharacterized protein LOC108576007 [Habropoda laboriosa]KOC61296.1 hypothetical protein WH47_06120 [Habropoda laboriosa]
MESSATTFTFILICLLLRFYARAEDQAPRISRKIDGARYCDFDEARKNYNATDLIECIDELAVDLVDRESGRLTSGKGQWNGFKGRQISFMDVLSSFFNNDPATSHPSGGLPADTTSGYQQSNYPAGTVGLSPGFQLNLFDAVSTISRHDDYKCVPRILCEMASGKLPGRSLSKHGSGFFDFLGRNVFTDWLTKIDVIGASPLLNFGRAMILGYSNRGNSETCYEAFPRCPKDMNGLIYYLNNYNGGFFRLFNKYQKGHYRKYNGVPNQRVGGHSKIAVRGRITSGNFREYSQNEPVRSNVQFPIVKYQEYFKKREFPKHDKLRTANEIIFPNQNELNVEPATKNLQDETLNWNSVILQNDNVAFFPQVEDDRRFSRFRFPSKFEDTTG